MKSILKQLGNPDVEYPFTIRDKSGKVIYYEDSNGFWYKREFDNNGKVSYYENSYGNWEKWEYDNNNGKEVYFENSDGNWEKWEYDNNGKVSYYENSRGEITDNRIKELTIDDIAEKFGVSADKIKIKK